jgi:hypothetical protein
MLLPGSRPAYLPIRERQQSQYKIVQYTRASYQALDVGRARSVVQNELHALVVVDIIINCNLVVVLVAAREGRQDDEFGFEHKHAQYESARDTIAKSQ